jgi:FG-GAP-like repeat
MEDIMYLNESDNKQVTTRRIASIFLMAAATLLACVSLTAAQVHTQHVVDMNGDGHTDFSVTRNINNQIVWFTYDGMSAQPNGITYSYFGLATSDTLVPEDYDDDNKTDIAIWRPGAGGVAGFYILKSTDNTIRFDPFGVTNDDPTVVADYDGDGAADPAVYRCPDLQAGQCYFFYKPSLNNPGGGYAAFPWGFGTSSSLSPYVGDFDGDGKSDFCVQRANPSNPSAGQFILIRSTDSVVEFVDFGFALDTPVTGDYDGDGKTDIAVTRRNYPSMGLNSFFVLTRTGNFVYQQWGLNNDLASPGDYDGDGKTDFAVWRPSAAVGQTSFYVLQSSDGAVRASQWGQCPQASCDVPVANWSVPQG